jgi:hypothetical protein
MKETNEVAETALARTSKNKPQTKNLAIFSLTHTYLLHTIFKTKKLALFNKY